jgi:opacity protein-like surface antigen
MKKLLAAVLAVSIPAAAGAADLPNSNYDSLKDISSTKVYFNGVSIGVGAGGQFTNVDITDAFDGIGADGLIGTAHVGYDRAFGRLRMGVYAEGGLSNVNVELGGLDLLKQDYFFGGGARLGVMASNTTLVYAKGGYEWALWSSDVFPGDVDVQSFVVGGGVETMLSNNISFGVDVSYLIPNDISADGVDVTDAFDKSESVRVLGKLSWRQ